MGMSFRNKTLAGSTKHCDGSMPCVFPPKTRPSGSCCPQRAQSIKAKERKEASRWFKFMLLSITSSAHAVVASAAAAYWKKKNIYYGRC
jgi:hypothetical protein